jgi:hypothetical protein
VIVLDDTESNAKHNKLTRRFNTVHEELRRSSQPIYDVYVHFNIDIPVTHPHVEEYRNRLENGIQETLQAGQLKYNLLARA